MMDNGRITATQVRHVKTWGRARLKPEGTMAKVALAAQPNKSLIESHTPPSLKSADKIEDGLRFHHRPRHFIKSSNRCVLMLKPE
jgi:hypothetical protein